jgi:hypothetical protein
LVRFRFVFHFDEREPARAAGVAIRHNPGAVDGAVSFKQASDSLFTDVEVKVAHKNVLHSDSPHNLKAGSSGRKHKRDDGAVAPKHSAGFAGSYQTRFNYTMRSARAETGENGKPWTNEQEKPVPLGERALC